MTSDPEQACSSRVHPQREAWVFPQEKEGLVRVPTGLPSRSPPSINLVGLADTLSSSLQDGGVQEHSRESPAWQFHGPGLV